MRTHIAGLLGLLLRVAVRSLMLGFRLRECGALQHHVLLFYISRCRPDVGHSADMPQLLGHGGPGVATGRLRHGCYPISSKQGVPVYNGRAGSMCWLVHSAPQAPDSSCAEAEMFL